MHRMQAHIHKRGGIAKQHLSWIVIGAGIISALDGFLKFLALVTRTTTEPFTPILPSVLSFGLHKNTGAIANIPLGQPFILIVSVLLIACLIVLGKQQYQKGNFSFTSATAVLLFGAVNNFLDRLLHGFTTDYLLVGPISLVNLSDGLILLGVLWLVVEEMRLSSSP